MIILCKNCGSQFDENMPFCPGCGTVNNTPPGSAPPQQFVQQGSTPQQQYIPPQPTPPQQFVQQGYAPQQQYVPPQPTPQQQFIPQQETIPQQQYITPQPTPAPQFTPQEQQFTPQAQQFTPQQQQFQQPAQIPQAQQFTPPQQQFTPPPQQYPPQQPPPQQPPQGYSQQGVPAGATPKKRISKTLLIIFGIAALVIAGGIIAAILLSGGYENNEFFEVGGDSIPSVKYILGEKRSISSVTNTTSRRSEKMVIEYSVDRDQGDEMEEYALALMKDFDFVSVNGYDFSGRRGSDFQFARLSDTDDEYVVLVSIDFDNRGYTLTITRGEGTINTGGPGVQVDPTPTPTPDNPTPTPDDPTKTDDPVVDTPVPGTPTPGAGEIDLYCPGVLLGNTIEEAQAKVPSGVTVVERTANGDFILRLPADLQQRAIIEAIADIEGVIMDIYHNHPGVDNVKWNSDDFSIIYIVVNDAFSAVSNQQQSSDALLKLALFGPMVQIYQGMGFNAVTLIAFGDEEIENILGELYSPACLYELAG